jgi:hypothetical protein
MLKTEFRVWCKDRNEWEKDYFVLNSSGRQLHHCGNGFIPVNDENHPISFYTGFKDMNGTKIYGGDILHIIENGNFGGEYYGEVKFLDKWNIYGIIAPEVREISRPKASKCIQSIFNLGFISRHHGNCIALYEIMYGDIPTRDYSKIIVIGNIFQNPEIMLREKELYTQRTMHMFEILKKLHIVQEVSNAYREEKLGRGYSTACRLNPYNPISYLYVPFHFIFAILLLGVLGFIKEKHKNPFKWN